MASQLGYPRGAYAAPAYPYRRGYGGGGMGMGLREFVYLFCRDVKTLTRRAKALMGGVSVDHGNPDSRLTSFSFSSELAFFLEGKLGMTYWD